MNMTSSTCTTMNFPSFVNISVRTMKDFFEGINDSQGTFHPTRGIEVEFLDVLAQFLHFRYNILVPADGEYGKEATPGNWSGVIGMVSRGEADLGLATLGVTESRARAVGFTVPYSSQDTTFATAMPQRLPKGMAFLMTFELNVWMAFLVSLVAVCFTLKLVLRRGHSQTHLCFKVLGGLFSEQLNLRIVGWKERSLMGSWLLGSSVMGICYTAVLSAFLAIPLYEREVANVRELAQEVDSGRYRCFITKGTLAHAMFYEGEQESLRLIGDHIQRHKWLRATNGPSRKRLIEEGHTAVVGPRGHFQLEFGKDVTKYLSKDSIAITYTAIALRPGFCCRRALDVAIRRIMEAGLYEFYMKTALFKSDISSTVPVPEDEEIAIQMGDIEWTLVMLCIGYVLGFVSLIIETFLDKSGLGDAIFFGRKDGDWRTDVMRLFKKRLKSKNYHQPNPNKKRKRTHYHHLKSYA